MTGLATLLLAVRLYALLLVQSAWWAAAGRAWGWIALLLSIAWSVVGGARGDLGSSTEDVWARILAEVLLGLVLGAAVSLPGHALLAAARLQAIEVGVPAGPWRHLSAASAAALALHLGLHRPAVVSLLALERSFPVGQPQLWSLPAGAEAALVDAASGLLILGLALATPVLLVAAVVALAAGALPVRDTDAPALGAAALGLRVCGALAALAAAWSTFPEIWAQTVAPRG